MSPSPKPLRIAHLSDLHIARTPGRGEWNLKRLIGHVNYSLFRSHRYKERVAAEAIRKLMLAPPDAVILTGDTTQLGLDAEFDAVERLLSPLSGAGIPVIAIAGNHDIYGGSRERFEQFRRRVALGLRQDQGGIVHLPGVEILPLEQGIASPPFFSNGRQGVDELERADPAWRAEPSGVVRLACGHYPVIDPHEGKLHFMHGLKALDMLADFCRAHRVAAYFCGHSHRRFSAVMPGGCVQYSAPALSDARWEGHEKVSVFECHPDGEGVVVVEV